ncbi:MAG: YeeE/YedE family protein [Rhodobacteraceae bacterium]|nr:YeeE/YedE family protein [Paracoccaceae bacterium]
MILNWKTGGVFLGLVFLTAVLLVKPIGVSTQFVILDAIIWDSVSPDVITQAEDGSYSSTNAYLDRSNGKYAKNAANPLNYSFVFVIAMMIAAGVSSYLRKGVGKEERNMPDIWKANFGDSTIKRFVVVFFAGFVVVFGARLAGGCTSGHMMSGLMQTSISGYMFTLGAFGAAIPVAMLMYRKEG